MKKLTMRFKKLSWDSQCFGLPIFNLEIEGNESTLLLNNKIQSIQGFIYMKSKTYLREFDSFFIDEKVCFRKELNKRKGIIPAQINLQDYSIDDLSNDDIRKIKMLSVAAGSFSRFNRDVLLKENFVCLYERWGEKSITKEIADEVFVIRDKFDIVGFVTILKNLNFCEIGLIAVDASEQGKGIGKRLLDITEQYAFSKNLNAIKVPTQRINKKACLFYGKNGFKEVSSEFVYHVNNYK